MNLIIDIGNTNIKVAVFEQNRLFETDIFELPVLVTEVKKKVEKHQISAGIISNVGAISKNTLQKLSNLCPFLQLSATTNLPFKNLYETPQILGVDRIALAAAASVQFANKNTLIIDAGTCITYDFINKTNEYLGGAISPGIAMRFKSLHKYTSRLPHQFKKEALNFIGNNTENAINSGVIFGVINEIEGIINQYSCKFKDLTIVLTGGDTNFLSKQLKSGIFANSNFLLEGLNEILIFNSNK